jgi:hypothetical protein
MLALLAASAGWAQQPGPIQPPAPPVIKRIPLHPVVPPPPLAPDEIIQRFTANEAKYKAAFAKFGYLQTVEVDELGTGGAPNGSYSVETEVFLKPDGGRYERVLSKTTSTLEDMQLSTQDLEVLAEMPLFPLAGDATAQYTFEYRGTEKLDQLMTYIFSVQPKSIVKGKPLFSGLVWVDNVDLAIVKSYGEFLTGAPKGPFALPFKFFETYRVNTEGRYWFPAFIRSDEVITKHGVDIPIRLIIRSTGFRPGQPVLPKQATK